MWSSCFLQGESAQLVCGHIRADIGTSITEPPDRLAYTRQSHKAKSAARSRGGSYKC